MSLNFVHWTDSKIASVLAEGRMHLHFMISIYHEQLEGGRHFLHEHPPGGNVVAGRQDGGALEPPAGQCGRGPPMPVWATDQDL